MKKFHITTNRQKDPTLAVTGALAEYLEKKGADCTIQTVDRKMGEGYDARKIPVDTECILVLGGDGTLIQAAGAFKDTGIPLYGINLGTLGFLADTDKNGMLEAMDRLLSDDFFQESRMMIQGKYWKESMEREKCFALNDITIMRKGSLRVLQFNIAVNGEHLYTYKADGILISTPTGSTAYNLSAGGPIVSPTASMMILTPICPHTLNKRSIVLSAEDVISITLEETDGITKGKEAEAEIVFDGNYAIPMGYADQVDICKAEMSTKLLRTNRLSFLENLRKKMGS